MTLILRTAVLSDVGRVRAANEDAAVGGPRLAAVADGMGGHAAGEVASQIAITVLRELESAAIADDVISTMRSTLDHANSELRRSAAEDKKRAGMGTTLTALLAVGDHLGLLHIGDSRAYLLHDGALTQVTHDQTYVQMLVDAGKITPEQAYEHPKRNVVLQSLDGDPDIDPDVSLIEAVLGDRWLLCSDGLSGVVDQSAIEASLLIPDRDQAAQRLIDLALAAGAPDNVTVVVADVEEDDDSIPGPSLAGAAVAALPRRDTSPVLVDSEVVHDPPDRMVRKRPLLARIYVIPAATFVLIALLLAGAGAYVNSQYYVGESRGMVAVFHGLPSLSRVSYRTTVPATALDDETRRAVERKSISGSKGDVFRRFRELMATACSQKAVKATKTTPAVTPESCKYTLGATP